MEERLKRAVIKEELVVLTGNYVDAIVLNQFIYWSERVTDFDKFIREELERADKNDVTVNLEPTNGWIYKKAEELSDETMLNLSKSNMMNHIKVLVDAGWVEQRRNPKNKMDKTYQYRVNILKIQRDLLALGYALEGYRVPLDLLNKNASSKTELRSSKTKLRSYETELRGAETELRSSETEQQYQRLHTETTTEITPNNNKGTVAVVQERIESHLGKSIKSLAKEIPGWLETYGEERLVKVATFISRENKWSNPVGAFRSAIEKEWDINAMSEVAAALKETVATLRGKHQHVRDERYSAFYDLFPDV